ncbi:PREDICTED: protein PMR5-like isoform X2 [Lupinus angustifolius]|uniref:protein PMR5-like isoform X2 n=1 Tax=Lupinus angustifolius TaxID=3871 RepID=UPI00092F3A00|nr:PREDICTED: protein PMR5-like isoform X2 [Lupinus angustifolius]
MAPIFLLLLQPLSSSAVSALAFLFLVSLQCHVASSALILSLRHHHSQLLHQRPMIHSNQTNCALFMGTWVRDDTYPLYQSSSCPIIDPEFNCQMYGRPDSNYLKYRWRPLNCELPRFNGVEFLLGMRGKSVMFVGDSLGRNQWQSLICMISAAAPQTQTQLVRGEPLSTFRFLDYGVTISFYRAPYLVEIDVVQGKRILRLEELDGIGAAWRSADVLSFNTGHWWSHQGSLQGWDYIELGGKYYPDMDRLAALERGMKTWANWVDTNIDKSRTKVFFLGISPSHNNPSEWSTGVTTKNCYGETEPITGSGYPGAYPDQMRVVDTVIREMNNHVYLLDITILSAFRKDAHPSIYDGDLSPEQRAKPDYSADCSHWCLPGLPDTWNQLFYTALFY